jgi:hypothetical protein
MACVYLANICQFKNVILLSLTKVLFFQKHGTNASVHIHAYTLIPMNARILYTNEYELAKD